MTCDYEAIRRENIKEYGEGIGRFGKRWLVGGYAERTHFIFELLQNAEDALARRNDYSQCRTVYFDLCETSLRVSHYGAPFNEADVKGICGIDESTKEFNEIGRFGVGFKSVYAFTDRPKIHSGSEDFAIEEFVRPVASGRIERQDDETVILIPFKPTDNSACEKITDGLERLGGFGFLFLRHTNEISWRVEDGPSGQYLRDSKELNRGVRRVTIVGQQDRKSDVDEEWLVFSRSIQTEGGGHSRPIEIAFLCIQDEQSGSQYIHRINRSPLFVFFPTDVETHLGFLIQGPYITTPSRDNIARDEDWNKYLVKQTALLLRDSLLWLRDHDYLDTEALRCLPLDPSRFGDTSMFYPLFECTKEAFTSDHLLPRFDGGYIAASHALLGRTQELRELFSSTQLGVLYGEDREMAWLTDDITQDRTPEVRNYVTNELDVEEIVPNDIVRRLNTRFLEVQSDDWIQKLYEFLGGQRALHFQGWFSRLPWVRLKNGKHVPAKNGDSLLAFLPTEDETDFPTVRSSVCETKPAREFLVSLGLKEPDLVDDVIEHIIPTYFGDRIDVDDEKYQSDIGRILKAIDTDSSNQLRRLLECLKNSKFVRSVDAGNDSRLYEKPTDVYLAKESLKVLFSGVAGILFVDDSCTCPSGQAISALLERCGAVRHLRPIKRDNTLSYEERSSLREKAGHPETSGRSDEVDDRTLKGLNDILDKKLPTLDLQKKKDVACLLWNELAYLVERRGEKIFSGDYTWTHYGNCHQTFDAAFVRYLNATCWVPDKNGQLHRPDSVLFESLGWKPHPFLQTKIKFKPPAIETLAREAGLDPRMLDFLKMHQITNLSELQKRIGLENETDLPDRQPSDPVQRSEKVQQQAAVAPDRTTEERTRSVSVNREGVKKEAKVYLTDQYTREDGVMLCQICKMALPFKLAGGNYYFEAVEFLKDLEKHHHQNYLALCPNHAVMFVHPNDSTDEMKSRFLALDGSELELTLADQSVSVYLTDTHIADLRAVIEVDDAE